ncbi:MAG TPA: hypothetical protein VGM56_29635 [Byssovorax sp.]
MNAAWKSALAAALVVALAPSPARADPPSSSSSVSSSAPLPELPRLQPIATPEPDAASLKELDRILAQITSDDASAQRSAKAAIAEAGPALVPAIRVRVQEIRGALDRDAAPRLLEAARKAGRKSLKKEKRGHHKEHDKDKDDKAEKSERASKRADKDDDDDGDWLDFVLVEPHAKDAETWRQLVTLLASERMLTAIGTTPAVRELIQLHAYFGEMLRVDLQRQVAKLKDKAVPALLEARQHDAKIIQRWAAKELDALGRAIPGETVASNDTQILADVLRAYGRTRDVDAVRVVLSFCNSERAQLRDASREAIAAIGEPGLWQLRDQYLGLTGQKPPKDWGWDRIARELFAVYDRARLVEVEKLMDDGVAAAKAGKLPEAVDAFDKVLARAPLFDRRKEMVPTYLARAGELDADKRADAIAMLRKALRLDPKGPLSRKIESAIDAMEGAASIDEGKPDRALLERAVDLDPANDRARQALASLEERAVARPSRSKQYAAAAGLGLLALVAMIFLVRWKPKPPGGPRVDPGKGSDASSEGSIATTAEAAPPDESAGEPHDAAAG